MKSHFEHLLIHVPDLKSRRILDLGSGKGTFIIDALQHGGNIVGVELFDEYIAEAKKRLIAAGLSADIKQGVGEKIPFSDNSFDFVNMSEVIEHVENPHKVLEEVYRVLSPSGTVYMSIPNRYSFRDQHFKLYGLNWIPRSMSSWYIGLFQKHKAYTQDAGHQRLENMHYATFSGARKLARNAGFDVTDMRLSKIKSMSKAPSLFGTIVYRMLRPWYFDSFHLLLEKKLYT